MEDREDSKNVRIMRASRGDKFVEISVADQSKRAANSVAEIKISSSFYERSKELRESDAVRDFDVFLPQVRIDLEKFQELDEKLELWLASREGFSLLVTPTEYRDQLLSISIEERDGFICSVDRPVFTLIYECGPSLGARASFIVDESCVHAWLGHYL